MPWRLVALSDPLRGKTVSLGGEPCVIGRHPECDVQISLPSVSRRHCVIQVDRSEPIVRDEGSRLGTFVGGAPIQERRLAHGDFLVVGTATFLVLCDDAEVVDTPEAPPDESADIDAATLAFEGMVGESEAMARVRRFIAKVAPTSSAVLILGESGTGKECVARAIHAASPRRSRPLIAINCAALSDALLESELFGHEKGAFTGAVARKRGKLELADGGTVFLDEVGELPEPVQAKLLRFLEDHTFERVGGSSVLRPDLRVIAATNRDLAKEVAASTFREDLYHRLNVISIELPPLRERGGDVGLLATHFAALHSSRAGRVPLGLSPAARSGLERYSWPGNVRELSNALERAAVLSVGERIEVEDLPEAVIESCSTSSGLAPGGYHETLNAKKRELILDAVQRAGGRITAAAETLGLHPNYLHRLIRNLGLRPEIDRRQG